MKIIRPVFLSLLLNCLLVISIVLLVSGVPHSYVMKEEPIKVNLETSSPQQEGIMVQELGDLVKKTNKKSMEPVVLMPNAMLEKKSIAIQNIKVVKKKSINFVSKLPKLVTKNTINTVKYSVKPITKKKVLGEKVLVTNVPKQYFQVKNIGTDLASRKTIYEIKNVQFFSIDKRNLNYNLSMNDKIEKKAINFNDLNEIKGGNILFNNADSVKDSLESKYKGMVQNSVNRNLPFPKGKITIEAIFYPDGVVKITSIYGGSTSPALQNLLKTSIQSLSFVATKKVTIDITYNFDAKPGGLK